MIKNKKICAIGECMIEISNTRNNNYIQSVAGDTLNFSSYLEKKLFKICYLTSIGKSKINKSITNFIRKKNISLELININKTHETGLYLIQNSLNGEKQFYYWRGQSAAKNFFRNIDFKKLFKTLKNFDYIYFTGITISIFEDRQIKNFANLLFKLRINDVKIIFDLNIRKQIWKPKRLNKSLNMILPLVDILFASGEDLFFWKKNQSCNLFFNIIKKNTINHGIFRKNAIYNYAYMDGIKYFKRNKLITKFVDSSGAGDGFNAAYFSNFIKTKSPLSALKAGSNLGSKIIMKKGAIVDVKK